MFPGELFASRTPKHHPKTSLHESIDMLLSNSWPYQSICPIQAYLIGVFGCLAVFGAYVFVTLHVGRMRVKKRRGRRRWEKTRLMADRLGRESRPDICKRRAIPDDTDCYQRTHSAPNKTGKTHERLAYPDRNEQDADDTPILKVDSSSYELFEHMNSFPLETDTQLIRRKNQVNSIAPRTISLPDNQSTAPHKIHAPGDRLERNDLNTSQAHFDMKTDYSLSNNGIDTAVSPDATTGAGAFCTSHKLRIAPTLSNVQLNDAKGAAAENQLTQTQVHVEHHTTDSLPEANNDTERAAEASSVTNSSNEKKSSEVTTTHHLDALSMASPPSHSQVSSDKMSNMETAPRAPIAQSKYYCSVNEAGKENIRDPKTASIPYKQNVGLSSQDLSSKTLAVNHSISNVAIRPVANDDASDATKELNTPDSPHIVVLVSIGVTDYTQAATQKATLKLLDDLDLPYKVIDGIDPLQHQKRNELFKMSGIRGNYPQIFVSERGTCHYLGDYGRLEESVDKWIKACGMKYEMSTLVHEQPDSGSGSNGNGPPTICHYNGHVTLLVSNGVVDYIQASDQKAAMRLLTDFCIPYKIVDGMDPSQRDQRNELFKISGIRGNYPQLFVFDKRSGQHRYLGGYDWLDGQRVNDRATILGETSY